MAYQMTVVEHAPELRMRPRDPACPECYGFPGVTARDVPDAWNRLLPTWKGCAEPGCAPGFGDLGALVSGSYAGSIGRMVGLGGIGRNPSVDLLALSAGAGLLGRGSRSGSRRIAGFAGLGAVGWNCETARTAYDTAMVTAAGFRAAGRAADATRIEGAAASTFRATRCCGRLDIPCTTTPVGPPPGGGGGTTIIYQTPVTQGSQLPAWLLPVGIGVGAAAVLGLIVALVRRRRK